MQNHLAEQTRNSLEEQLKKLLGEAVSTSELERGLYAQDLAAVPPFLSKALLRATPDAVVRPRTTEEVSAILRYASDQRVPVTPRAAGSTAFYDAVPTKGGILLDMNALRGIVEVDATRRTATVLAATRWKELDDELRYKWGLAVKTSPTSAPSATVGGWLNMGGLGVGSLAYGPLRDLVEKAEVILPNGEIRILRQNSDPPLSWFAGADGTLGAIAKLELSVRPVPAAQSNHLLAFDKPTALQQAIRDLATSSPRPYYLHMADEVHERMTRAAGFASPGPEGYCCLLVRYEGEAIAVEAGASRASTVAKEHGGLELPQEAARDAWDHRFSEVRLKRAGPTLLGVELMLPLPRVADFIQAARKMGRNYDIVLYTYGAIFSETHIQLNAFFPTDERRELPYLLSLSITKKLHDIARRLGGRPYGIGLWNTPYLGYAYAQKELQELRRRKRLLDPSGIMNPGKLYAPPALLAPVLFGLGMDVLAMVRRVGGEVKGLVSRGKEQGGEQRVEG